MATITRSIGTSGRDYSTVTLWEADLDNGAVYSASDDAVGEMYNDSVFSESLTLNGGGTIGLSSVRLTAASGEKHDGTEGTGARVVNSSFTWNISGTSLPYTIEDIEFSRASSSASSGNSIITRTGADLTLQRLLMYGCHNESSGASARVRYIFNAGGGATVFNIQNCILYDMENARASSAADRYGIWSSSGTDINIQNNTIYRITQDDSSGDAYGISIESDDADTVLRNNISMDASNAGSGPAADFFNSGTTNIVVANNLSSDTSAPGTGSLTNEVAADEFVSTVVGSEDLHLKSGAAAINAGLDLGTTPTGINIDIDGRDRDAEGDTWDIGAHEFVSAAPTAVKRTLTLTGAGR